MYVYIYKYILLYIYYILYILYYIILILIYSYRAAKRPFLLLLELWKAKVLKMRLTLPLNFLAETVEGNEFVWDLWAAPCFERLGVSLKVL
jgi:hypothetical protein